ncbi:class IIb bacteriocin, lactobin A/cerein 7B family [Massilia solisilvae]|uniref:Class IIb bacteriocin, lactobin A/cerein 7B family n=1 Tax=Massilia solisilvae TaxID=1811225 RepID=A0ABT2BE31_9BURK|nr:class IIb bacteriocin, lactobin A/cerein 7B family [Massilia solisilvae]MCS0606779.1 class IIb bacteriocin, lactobin A/cerein 7B family [Massilia solisilvae]
MQELNYDEIEAVNGGSVLLILAGIAIGAAVGVGIYNGYKDAENAAKQKK